ncbi:MAG: putative acetyltransferase [Francisella sp.]
MSNSNEIIKIRRFQHGDEFSLWQIKNDTIRNVNIRDYSKEQIKVWASDGYDEDKWSKRIREMNPYVAEIDGQLVGFADVQKDGYIDHFFCHHKYLGQGIGKTLMQYLIYESDKNQVVRLYSHVSITAKPFFEKYGFYVIRKQLIEICGQKLDNYVMEKI